MEGTVLGIPSIAMSQSFGALDDVESNQFACAVKHGPALLKRLVEIGWPETVLLNVNFPALPPSKVKRVNVTRQGQRDQSILKVDQRVDARGRTYFWVGFKRILSDPERGTDLHAIAEGCISVTPLHLDLTELREQKRLSGLLDGSLARLGRAARTKRPASGSKGKTRSGRSPKAAGRFRTGE